MGLRSVSNERLISLLKKFNIPEDCFVILLPGRITRWKGHKLFIEAIDKLQRPDIICLIVGDFQGRNKYYAELERHIDQFKLKKNFRIIPNQIDMAMRDLKETKIKFPRLCGTKYQSIV